MFKQSVGSSPETRQTTWLPKAACGMLALLIIAGLPIAASTQSNPNPTFSFPIVAVINGQSARVSVANRTGSPGDLPPDVCDVELVFLDRTGIVRAQSTIKGLGPGQSAHLDLSASKLLFESGKRHALRAFVRISALSPQLPADVCKPSVEIYDEATGETRFYTSPPDPDLPAPQ
jgi:hypothetical protein